MTTTFDVKITIKDADGVKIDERNITGLEYEFGTDINEAVEMHGKEVVFNNFVANAKVGRQAFARSLGLQVGADGNYVYNDEEIHTLVSESTLELRKPGKSQEDKMLDVFSSLDAEAQQRLLQKFAA